MRLSSFRRLGIRAVNKLNMHLTDSLAWKIAHKPYGLLLRYFYGSDFSTTIFKIPTILGLTIRNLKIFFT